MSNNGEVEKSSEPSGKAVSEKASKPRKGIEPANVDEAVQYYSKKWGVSEDEAAEKIQKLLESRKAPSMEDLFPEPLGELSRKVQDVNQAVLSTAFTRKKVQELEGPPSKTSAIERTIDDAVHEVGSELIKAKLTGPDPIRQKVDEVLGDVVGEALKARLGHTSDETKAMLDGLFDEFGEKVIKPMYEDIKALKGAQGQGKEQSINETLSIIQRTEQESREFLEKRGFKVESVSITRDTVEKMISDAVASARQKWETNSGRDAEVEKERIKATETILVGLTDRLMDIFLVPIKDKIEAAISQGAFRGAAA